MGKYSGDTRVNHKGRIIHSWIQSNGLINWNQRIAYVIPTSYSYSGHSIVDYFLSSIDLASPTLTVRDDLSLESTHKLLTFSFQMPSFTPNNIDPVSDSRKIWNIKKLRKEKMRETYQQVFKEHLNLILPPLSSLPLQKIEAQRYIERINTSLLDALYKSLDTVFGTQETNSVTLRSKEFWTTEMMETFEMKELYYRKWKKTNGLNCLKYWLLHQETKAKLRKLIFQRRKETWQLFCDKMKKGEYTKAITKFSRIRKNRLLRPVFSTIDGPQKAADLMADHLKQTLSDTNCPRSEHISILPCLSTYQSSQECFALTNCPFNLDEIKSLYTPQLWRISQIVPIHKKGDPSDPSNYRPISLTSVFRKILEKCIQPELLSTGPTLDVAQGGFRESRGSLDQVLCLTELCQLYYRKHLYYNSVLGFLDIKSAYDTVDPLFYNLFEEVSIEVILSNHKSSRFPPKTSILQGSVLSPYLYSVYINSLPNFLRPAPLIDTDFNDPLIVTPKLNCLLYADDVVLIADADSMQSLLSKCEEHSLSLGYRWNPKKHVIVDPSPTRQKYYLYNSELPNTDYFPYLGVPIKPGGIVDNSALLQQNINKALGTIRQLITLVVHKNGLNYLLSARFYAQIVRPKLEYGLAITTFNLREVQSLENRQNHCIHQIFGGRSFTSTKVMLHLANLPNLKVRISILQAQFLFRASSLSDDALVTKLLPYIKSQRISKWSQLSKSPLWTSISNEHPETMSHNNFIRKRRQFLIDNHRSKLQAKYAKLLSHCRNDLIVDPILRIPMTRNERSCCVRWRLGWLPLDMHNCLQMPKSIDDPFSYLLNLLPPTLSTRKVRQSIDTWLIRWPSICAILLEMDYLAHSKFPEASNHLGEPFVERVRYIQRKFSDSSGFSFIFTAI
ncbi:hypothetical protein G6F48_008896 [Rhizopus delemar]|nr:hypothetical protein G6F48_008896 [Rhizopus delemar]